MKRTTLILLALGLLLTACGRADLNSSTNDASATKDAAYIHKIQPLGVSTSCVGSYERIIRDHRTNPTTVYSQYLMGVKDDCSAPASSLIIQMLGGQQWVGGLSYVTIKKNGLCLTNPITSASGGDKGENFWQTCIPQLSSTPEHYRQQWLLSFNNHNAMRIETHAAVNLGLPNAQVQCLDRQDPTTVKRVACTLNNWQVIRAN